ncbi:amidophosphoribosyltransferase [Plantactinospora sp. WMMC1484]|uniref:amidophosphoribosyltransferase n=1 Tax=Plantactinospora sp. WMMC1484 TaxID=3404122 RepID=UPI003BF5BF45
MRTLLSVGAALAVIYFGSTGQEGDGVTNTVLLLAVAAGLTVWYLTRPTSGKPVS